MAFVRMLEHIQVHENVKRNQLKNTITTEEDNGDLYSYHTYWLLRYVYTVAYRVNIMNYKD